MYSRLHAAIRQHDDQHIIFFEPTIIITSLPFTFSETGLTEGPGGAQYNDRQVFSYHLYCIIMDKNGQVHLMKTSHVIII
jgi:endoglycosylceramidase